MPKRVALVTGASRGIGAAIARKLAAEGYAVAVHYAKGHHEAEAITKEINQGGGTAIAVQADIGVEAEIVRLFAAVDKQLGPLSVLVNNAAINLRDGDGGVERLEWGSVERVFAVNIIGLMTCCREAIKRMKEGAAIVNISSEAGRGGGNRMTPYAASKAAVNTFTLGFAREAAAKGVRVNAVSPGVIATQAHAGASEERMQALHASIPLGRLGEPEEVAEAVAWLLSDKASYVSGAVLSVAGAR